MKISAHQPAYLPWLGYLDKIARSDVFVFLDGVQFEKSSFINRNRIKTPNGPQWLTIPLKMKGHMSGTIASMVIDDGQPWRTKHLKSIEANYARAPFFQHAYPDIRELILMDESSLAELCWQQLQFWTRLFNFKARIVRSSELAIDKKKSDLVLALCEYFSADGYLSGAQGRDYLDEAAFSSAGIRVEYQDFQHPVYPQLWGAFEPRLSVLDYLFNCGNQLSGSFERGGFGIQQ